MTRILIAILFACVFAPSRAQARGPAHHHPDCNITMPCDFSHYATSPQAVRETRGRYVARQMGIGGPILRKPSRARAAEFCYHSGRLKDCKTGITEGADSPAPALHHGLVPQLAAKVAEIASTCGSKVISAVRHTLIAGTRRMSLHAEGKAADVAGNPSCIYSTLHGWSGGYSTDYGRVQHVHISYDASGGREMGVHFVHGGGHRHHHRTRYAHAG